MASQAYTYFNVTTPQTWVAHVEINRPDKLNAFLEPMWLELRTVFDNLSVDSSIRAIILSGAGDKAFSAGLDINAATAEGNMFTRLNPTPEDNIDGARRATLIRRWAMDFQDCVSSIERCEKPVICILHGIAIGISIDISTCADIRICSSDAKFSVKEVDIGLAADVGTLTRLPKVVGSYTWVKEVCMTARMFDASEALRVGFVSSVQKTKADAIQEGFRIATVLSEKSPVAVQGTKNFLDFCRDHGVAEGLKYTAIWNSAALQTSDVPNAIKGTMAKKRVTFEKL